jgi:hypothetical protein
MQNGTLDLIYFVNPKGWVAVSFDEGETLVIPDGRKITVNPVWEEVDDLEDQLSPKQQAELVKFRARPLMTEAEQTAWDMRKMRLNHARFYAQPEDIKPRIPESAQVIMGAVDGDKE